MDWTRDAFGNFILAFLGILNVASTSFYCWVFSSNQSSMQVLSTLLTKSFEYFQSPMGRWQDVLENTLLIGKYQHFTHTRTLVDNIVWEFELAGFLLHKGNLQGSAICLYLSPRFYVGIEPWRNTHRTVNQPYPPIPLGFLAFFYTRTFSIITL